MEAVMHKNPPLVSAASIYKHHHHGKMSKPQTAQATTFQPADFEKIRGVLAKWSQARESDPTFLKRPLHHRLLYIKVVSNDPETNDEWFEIPLWQLRSSVSNRLD